MGALTLALFLFCATIGTAGSVPVPPEVAWNHQRPGDGTSPQSAVPVLGLDTPAVAVAFSDRVDLMDTQGRLIWSATGLPAHGLSLSAADLTGDGIDDLLVATVSIIDPPARLTAVEGATGEVLWSQETGGSQVNQVEVWTGITGPSLVVTATMLGFTSGLVEAFHAEDGTPAWSHETQGVPTSLLALSNPLGIDGVIAVGTTTSHVHYYSVLGHDLGAVHLPGAGTIRDLVGVHNTPAGVVMIAVGQDQVVGLGGLNTPLPLPLHPMWSTTPGSERFWSATVAASALPLDDALVLVNGFNGPHVHALDAGTGETVWTAGESDPRTSFPFTNPRSILLNDLTGDGEDEVIAAGAGHHVSAYRLSDGEPLWSSPTPGPTDHLFLLGGGDARLGFVHPYWLIVALDAHGEPAWYHDYSAYQIGTTADWTGNGHPDAVVASAGHAYVHDGTTGELLFEAPIWPHLHNAVTTNIAATDLTGNGALDLVVTARTTTMQGVVVAFDATTSDVLWTAEAKWITGGLQGRFILTDTNGDGINDIIIGSNQGHPSHVIAIDGATGDTLWDHHVRDDVIDLARAPSTDGDQIIVLRDHTSCACFENIGILALDASSGTEQWSRDIMNPNARTLQISTQQGEDRVVVIDELDEDDGPFFLFMDPATGDEKRRAAFSAFSDEAQNPGSYFHAADLDGDGDDEIVFSLVEGSDRDRGARSQLGALQSDADILLWKTPLRDGQAPIITSNTMTGGQGSDLSVRWGDAVVHLRGSDAQTLWEHPITLDPVWFLAATTNDETALVFAPQSTRLDALQTP